MIHALTEDFYRRCLEDLDYSDLREPYRHTIRNYVERGLPPGEALRFALEGSIKALLATNDPAALAAVVKWIHGTLPAPLWGTPRRVEAWMKLARRISVRSLERRCTAPRCKSEFSAVAL
jgi:hypothetical protein